MNNLYCGSNKQITTNYLRVTKMMGIKYTN